jgi:transketolase
MRTAFFGALSDAAAADRRVTLVTGDMGFGVVEEFARRYPAQFVNAGVAEQNMTGLAAGLALAGRVVFTYSIGNFPTLRCLEQIRNDVAYHRLPVTVVTVGGGLSYGALGMSHHATEDLAILRAIPGLTVVAPGDPLETRAAVPALIRAAGPAYLRLGRAGEPAVHEAPPAFALGRALRLRDGTDATIIVTGGMLARAVAVADALREDGIGVRVVSMPTVKPLDEAAVHAAARETRAVCTLEEHAVTGGLGGAVAEVLAELEGPRVPFRRLGLPSAFATVIGGQDHLRDAWGLSHEAIATALRDLVARGRKGQDG